MRVHIWSRQYLLCHSDDFAYGNGEDDNDGDDGDGYGGNGVRDFVDDDGDWGDGDASPVASCEYICGHGNNICCAWP